MALKNCYCQASLTKKKKKMGSGMQTSCSTLDFFFYNQLIYKQLYSIL